MNRSGAPPVKPDFSTRREHGALAFAANAIHETHHRSLVVHSTSDALFAHNVAYDGTGHMYVLENGLELRNSIVGNVGMVTWPPEPAWSCPGHRCAGDGLSLIHI